jgi:hypothetical protein
MTVPFQMQSITLKLNNLCACLREKIGDSSEFLKFADSAYTAIRMPGVFVVQCVRSRPV